jgi:hypothetical protein
MGENNALEARLRRRLDARRSRSRTNVDARRKIVWELERQRAEDLARPITLYHRGAPCWQPQLKGFVLHADSIYNNWRYGEAWLDK